MIKAYYEKAASDLATIYFNTIHKVNSKDYTQEQLDAWAPESSLEVDSWIQRFARTQPIVALVNDVVVGFVEFELSGYIDCFYCHHEWIGKGVGKALMKEIFSRAQKNKIPRIFVDVSITAKPFFESQGFTVIKKQEVSLRGVSLTNYKMEIVL